MRGYLKLLAPAAAFGLLTFTGAFAQSQSQGRESTSTRGSAHRLAGDTTFATKAAEGGLAEVQFGNLARERASNPEVKTFAQRMVDDHTKANDELKSIAARENINLPTGMSAKDKATYDRLSKLNGAEFDKAYMRDMVTDHRADIAEFQREAAHGTDPDLKSFAGKTLPTLQQHLQLAEKADSTVKNEK
jgi:putative membrane protein